MLPFTREQFFAVFAAYNPAVWPAQLVAYVLAAMVVVAILQPTRLRRRAAGAALAALWAWTGIAYHGVFFAPINRAAFAFAAFFVLQTGLLLRAALRDRLEFGHGTAAPVAALGWALMVYASIAYPLVGMAIGGHRYPALPMFGITPCPLTIFTLGALLRSSAAPARALVAIPFAWSIVGGSAAFLLDVPQDWPLPASGIVVAAIALRRQPPRPVNPA